MNIILIGMPGCGKSTIGVLLAKALMLDFVDTDLLIQKRHGKKLSEIIESEGLEAFKAKEGLVLSELCAQNSIIATGGSAVYSESGMENLKSDGKVVYLKLAPKEIEARIKNIKTRGIVMEKGVSISDLYKERSPLYEKYADITLNCEGLSIEECVSSLSQMLK